MSANNVIRFPVERTDRGKQDEAMRVFFEARKAWREGLPPTSMDELPKFEDGVCTPEFKIARDHEIKFGHAEEVPS